MTGAGGFIGSHLAESLSMLGATVSAFIHYNAMGSRGWLDRSEIAKEIKFVFGDIADRDAVNKASDGMDTIFHLAALIGIPYSYHAPESYVRTNIIGTLNVLCAARDAGVRRVVHTSTSEVYGTARYVPINEAHPLHGQSPYSATKIGADKICESFYSSFNLPVVTVRPFNTFGPRQSARAVIPTIIAQCLANRDIHLGSVHPTRDLNYVMNTVDGYLLAGENEKLEGRVYNLGSGVEISIGELAKLVCEICGSRSKIVLDAARIRPSGSEVDRLLADSSRAVNELLWAPRVTLRDGLSSTIDWMRKNSEHYRADEYVI